MDEITKMFEKSLLQFQAYGNIGKTALSGGSKTDIEEARLRVNTDPDYTVHEKSARGIISEMSAKRDAAEDREDFIMSSACTRIIKGYKPKAVEELLAGR